MLLLRVSRRNKGFSIPATSYFYAMEALNRRQAVSQLLVSTIRDLVFSQPKTIVHPWQLTLSEYH